MMPFCEIEYISIGGNRRSAAADCSSTSSVIAFGADVNVALWQPKNGSEVGIRALLRGHTNSVTAVSFSTLGTQIVENLVSGSGDGEIRLWQAVTEGSRWECSSSAKAHIGAVNVIAFLDDSTMFATGGADGLLKLWGIDGSSIVLLHTISLKPRYIPLALVLGNLPAEQQRDSVFIAVGGTKASVQVFVVDQLDSQPQHELQATLTGHEGWIRSLSLLVQGEDFLLASASHDKYVRIWRIRTQNRKTETNSADPGGIVEKTLTRKVQILQIADSKCTIVFEALLLGHEDWIYSASWNPAKNTQQLLTASADGSLAIWEPDPDSGIWVSKSRLGEISGQKGATTATGSAGGFWVGLWSPDGEQIMCLDRSGSWRLWQHDPSSDYWTAKPGVSGHVGSANDIAWAPEGQYLLSTGSDQTSRLHAEFRSGQKRSWHEFARPQIHGYDLNCITAVSSQRFVSGADEKLLRVFDEPKNVSGMLQRLCGIEVDDLTDQPDAASMPVLGLSNKAADAPSLPNGHDEGETDPTPEILTITLNSAEPPTEDLLARHTLWPEHEKLYGHGYEISCAAANSSGTLLATACKASSTDHAVIRLYDTSDWHEIKPALVAHSLTVTRLAFSESWLLSVGRDRQWTVFQREDGRWALYQAFPKAHSRMVLDAAWLPSTVSGKVFFATAGRDKVVKLWRLASNGSKPQFELVDTLARRSAVTAISFTCDRDQKLICLAVGEEDGLLSLHVFTLRDGLSLQKSWDVEEFSAAKAVTRVQWRPRMKEEAGEESSRLAVAAADGSVRVLRVDWMAGFLESETLA
jgi:elongator complex protein 2